MPEIVPEERVARYRPVLAAAALAALLVAAGGPVLSAATRCAAAGLEAGEAMPGGAATSRGGVLGREAFSQFSTNMGFSRELDFKIGNGIFRKHWVSAPASTRSSSGLGPLFNARSCQSCHLKDGRGQPPASNRIEDRSPSMFLRLSVPPETEAQRHDLAQGRIATVPEPNYGGQLQEFAVQGHASEGRMIIDYAEVAVTLAGGEIMHLRRPNYRIANLGYGALHPRVLISPRVTPQMIGLGLLEAIPEADVRARADPDDRDGDGISGRANMVWSVEHGRPMLGRFGWKAGQPTVLQQSGEAFAGDIGIGNWIAPRAGGDCTPAQLQCLAAPHGTGAKGAGEEIRRKLLDLVAFYARNLAVPPRREPAAPEVLAGKALFSEIGCAACHTPAHTTGAGSPDAHLRGQRIWPYTDLLLHDMGEGLADGRPEGRANGREWRTAPLWGIGLTEAVNGHTFYLHDGRARSIAEAILWHGGEARRARDAFQALPAEARQKLIRFVASL